MGHAKHGTSAVFRRSAAGLGNRYGLYQGAAAAQRLSVAKPTKGYTSYEIDGNNKPAAYIAATGAYNETLDIPVDARPRIHSL